MPLNVLGLKPGFWDSGPRAQPYSIFSENFQIFDICNRFLKLQWVLRKKGAHFF